LPYGYLDTTKGKKDKATGMLCTFQEMMVKEFHFRREVDPLYVSRNIQVELKPVVARNQNIAMQAIRNVEEVAEIQGLDQSYEIVKLIGRGSPESSDENALIIEQLLVNNPLCESAHFVDTSALTKEEMFRTLDLLIP
jgi:hypothetical protein